MCSLISLVPSLFLSSPSSFSLPSFFFLSFSRSLSLLSSLLSSLFFLNNNDKALTCLNVSVSVRGLRSIPCWPNMFAACKKQLPWCFLCKPRATWNEVGLHLCWKWVLCLVVFAMCLCLVVFVCVWLCLFVFGCVSMRHYVIVCVVFVVWLVAVDALAVVW